ncbi:MAG: FAD-dependent monooxygenase [Chloroflexota bacterium]
MINLKRQSNTISADAYNGHAIVIGGSMAGLLAARVLADHYQQVTVLDRDEFPTEPNHRNGVPQSKHAHAILPKGQMIIGRMFPGIIDEMKAEGARSAGSIHFVTPMGPLAQLELPPEATNDGVSVSRTLLEWHVRHRLSLLENITLFSRVDVQGLTTTEDQTRVSGVRIHHRGGDKVGGNQDKATETMTANLIVDASGRHSKTPKWLVEMGYDAPPEETINTNMGYASRFYQKPANFHEKWDGILINVRPPNNPRAGLILPIEDDKWHVSVGGMAGHYPPTDEEGFLKWASELPDQGLYEAIRDAEPLSPIRGARTVTNHLRHYDKLKRWPQGLIVTGDAACCFNPIYGQGMTTSAMDANALRKTLETYGTKPGFERKFQQALAKVVANPWFVATGEDLRWEETKLTGNQEWGGAFRIKLTQRYSNLLLEQATVDPMVASLYFAVTGMIMKPRMFTHPYIMARVLGGTVKRRLQGISSPIQTLKPTTAFSS